MNPTKNIVRNLSGLFLLLSPFAQANEVSCTTTSRVQRNWDRSLSTKQLAVHYHLSFSSGQLTVKNDSVMYPFAHPVKFSGFERKAKREGVALVAQEVGENLTSQFEMLTSSNFTLDQLPTGMRVNVVLSRTVYDQEEHFPVQLFSDTGTCTGL